MLRLLNRIYFLEPGEIFGDILIDTGPTVCYSLWYDMKVGLFFMFKNRKKYSVLTD